MLLFGISLSTCTSMVLTFLSGDLMRSMCLLLSCTSCVKLMHLIQKAHKVAILSRSLASLLWANRANISLYDELSVYSFKMSSSTRNINPGGVPGVISTLTLQSFPVNLYWPSWIVWSEEERREMKNSVFSKYATSHTLSVTDRLCCVFKNVIVSSNR